MWIMIGKEGVGIKSIVTEKFPSAAVQLVGPGLRDQARDGSGAIVELG